MMSTAFFQMGGYGVYVWLAYGATVFLLAGALWLLWRRKRRWQRAQT